MFFFKSRPTALFSAASGKNGWYSGKIDNVPYLVVNGIPVPGPHASSNRQVITLDGVWQFSSDPSLPAENWKPAGTLDFSGVRSRWYRTEFLANGNPEKPVFSRLRIGYASSPGMVWLNGHLTGFFGASDVPQYFDVSALSAGKNTLLMQTGPGLVRPDRIEILSGEKYILKASIARAWSAHGRDGIEVTVLTAGACLSMPGGRCFVTASPSSDEVDDRVEVTLSLKSPCTPFGEEAAVPLKARLRSSGPEQMLTDPATGEVTGSVRAWRGRIEPESVALWSPETPSFYKLSVNLYTPGLSGPENLVFDAGISTLSIEDGKYFLNGKGVAFEEASPLVERISADSVSSDGMSPDGANLDRTELERLRALGCTFIRLSGFPRENGVLESARDLGIMLGIACPEYEGGVSHLKRKEFVSSASMRFSAMIENVGNNPAVIFWKLTGWETGKPGRTDRHILEALRKTARFFDGRRLMRG